MSYSQAIIGYIDEKITHCPYCGTRLNLVSLLRATKCEKCGQSFFVCAKESVEPIRKELRA